MGESRVVMEAGGEGELKKRRRESSAISEEKTRGRE